jgi:rare lipoprotein A
MRSSGRLAASRGWLTIGLSFLLASCGVPERPATRIAGRPVSDIPVKIGKPYQVGGVWYYPADDRLYDEVGLASWYGGRFHEGATANGESYDMDRVGAAHPTLPLPSYVEVTALDSGRTILVRINDRGPFKQGRIIDLSRRAAQLLGIDRAGVMPVRVRRVEPSESDRLALRRGISASARAAAPSAILVDLRQRFKAIPPATSGYYVQVGAFADRLRAEGVAASLAARLDATSAHWRVRLGPYADEQSAREVLARVLGQGYQDARLVPPTTSSRSPEWNQSR